MGYTTEFKGELKFSKELKTSELAMDNKVMIFIRPQESPVFTDDDKNIRIAYGDKWIDFKDGNVVVWDDKTGRFLEYKDLYVDGDRREEK